MCRGADKMQKNTKHRASRGAGRTPATALGRRGRAHTAGQPQRCAHGRLSTNRAYFSKINANNIKQFKIRQHSEARGNPNPNPSKAAPAKAEAARTRASGSAARREATLTLALAL